MFICLIDSKEFMSKAAFWRHIRNKHGLVPKEYHDNYMKGPGDGVCLHCHQETYFDASSYRRFCGVKCSSAFNGFARRGREIPQETRDKLSRANRERDPEWLCRRRKTVEERYGMTYEEHKRLIWNERFSKMTPEQVKEHYDKTVLAQGTGRARYKFKEYHLNGKTVNVQGYEPQVLDVLKKIIPEEQIYVGRSKEKMFRYVSEDGKEHRYFPDIIIDELKLVVEIKSPYTLSTEGRNIIQKMDSAKEAGWNTILCVWEPKQMEMCEKDLIETISSQAWSDTGRFNDYPFIGVGYKQAITEVLGTRCGL